MAGTSGLSVVPLTPERWHDLEDLFGPQGPCYGCWCNHFRMPQRLRKPLLGEGARRLFEERVRKGPPPGVLAYAGALALRYPPASVRSREQGTVVLRVLVDARGSAQRIELVRSSGHVRLDEAARDAVGRARFQPVLRNGEAIPAWGLVPVAFRLDRA